MTPVTLYDPHCENCAPTIKMIEAIAERLGIEVAITEESDPVRIAMAGVKAPPGIAVDGQLVHSGSVPDEDALEVWLAA